MIPLRDRWRRSTLFEYFASMDPQDRAFALIALALVAEIAAVFSALP